MPAVNDGVGRAMAWPQVLTATGFRWPRTERFMIRVLASWLFGVFMATNVLSAPPSPPAAPAPAATAPASPGVGDTARDFALKTPEGKSVTLRELTAKSPVVLVVLRGWPGYQCPICTKQVGDLIDHQKELAAAGAQLVLVYPGPSEYLKDHADEFVKGKALPETFTFVIDPDYAFVNAYGLRWNAPKETAYPSSFVIDTHNVVRFAKVSKTHGGRADSGALIKAAEQAK